MPHRTLFLITLLITLCGCQLWAPVGVPVRTLAPPFGEYRQFQRDLEIHHGEQIHQFVGVFDLTPESTRITVLTPSTQPVLTLLHDRRRIALQRTLHLPPAVSADDLIADLQLALWPLERLRAGLTPGWTLAADDEGRILRFNGVSEARVDYQSEEPSSQPLPVYNARHDYLLILSPAARDA